MKEYCVPLDTLVEKFHLEKLYYSAAMQQETQICASDVSRPGLNLCGFFEHFEPDRIQIFGNSETSYLSNLSDAERFERLDAFFAHKPVAVIVTRDNPVHEEAIALADKHQVPFFRTPLPTSGFSASLISILSVELAPRITRHGVLVEVYGEGILLLGESGVGKSETAVELIKRGHRLIADDAVEIKRVSDRTLVGSSPDNIRHFIELRGIGIVNARRIFGMGAVKVTEKIDLVIQMEQWDPDKVYDRLGMESEETEIMGIPVPGLTIPVKPGRNLAVIIEVAAMNNRQKKMGYNAAEELLSRLGMAEAQGTDPAHWETF